MIISKIEIVYTYRSSKVVASDTTSLFFAMLFFTLFAWALPLAVLSLKYECPEPEDIYPCYCEEEDDGEPNLFCNHFHKTDQLETAKKGLAGHRMYKLSFFMNWILDPVKSDAFKGISVEKIVFENSTITLNPPQFEGLEGHLKTIQLRAIFNKTNPVGSWSLGHLTKLKELVLDKNKIFTLPTNWLTSAPDSLSSLTFEYNDIITMEDEVFAKVKGLVFLVLDSNKLTSLKRNMFPSPAKRLRSMSLNYNKFRYLPHDLFTDMPELRIVEMTNNRLQVLEDYVWKNVFNQLTKLDFSDNPLQCDASLKWMLSSVSKPVLFYGECETPEKNKGKSIKRLRKEDLN
ncbi:leucine-rich repeat transmembrane protein FLRT3-like isoform X2 [Parasteatoda tepidariorum]|uniref:leucine-rich repeat transmembrane protein FLRT3-like isoform X2 n=1 Tax=Parasteatoda tepidariorum TaxID=114398 RepID=UPI00077FC213